MLDPWAEGPAPAPMAPGALHSEPRPPLPPSIGRLSAASRAFETEEVVTSAPPIVGPTATLPARMRTPAPQRPPKPPQPQATDVPPSPVDLTQVDAFGDLPDEARDAFAQAATVHSLAVDEEVSGFARLGAGAVLRARGTIEQVAPLRLVGALEGARVATWDELAVADAFRTCLWVEDELRVAGDLLQALVGVTMGPLGERLDPVLRADVTSRLRLRTLAEHEIFATRGNLVSGLLVVGAGELELLAEDGEPNGTVLRPGEFVFPNEALRAGPAPNSLRAGKGGALVLLAERGVAQELLVTCPPLLEIFAGG